MGERTHSDLPMKALLIGGAIFIGYRLLVDALGKFKEGAEKVGGAIGDQIAKWKFPAPVGVLGKIVLQDSGRVLDPIQYPIQWSASNDPRAANYGGQLPLIVVGTTRYVLGSHDLNGNYPAVKL